MNNNIQHEGSALEEAARDFIASEYAPGFNQIKYNAFLAGANYAIHQHSQERTELLEALREILRSTSNSDNHIIATRILTKYQK